MKEAAPRAAAALVVVALHVLALLLFILPARMPGIAVNRGERETVLYLMRQTPLPSTHHARPEVAPSIASPSRRRHRFAVSPEPSLETDLQGVGADLFSCRPEDIGGLSLDQQMRCAHVGLAAVQPPNLFALSASRARQSGRWTAALALKKSPATAPCFSHNGFNPFATAFYVADMAINGYDQDNHEKYYLGN